MLTIFFLWHLIPFSHGVYINGLRGLPIKAYAYEVQQYTHLQLNIVLKL